ncbi:snf2 domain-containing protein classy 2 [Phtheirospermum japonicum]|uniref:Snf2 domain-containing protein classy 2 n=1 Tax=Phtheirospermum japonicum TaxID=374723 RepID=A0A830CLX9_9LAMI|nr:snf2 domain-containing protein classy 2 [Phtheirospermum japonicum]
MKRRLIHKTNHPFDPHPFETFWSDSWKPVERLTINNGGVWSHIVGNGEVTEEDIPITNIRVRSRKATSSDCISFLRAGVDVCVLSPSTKSEDTNDKPVWMDARLRSIERKPHGAECECRFHVSFYIDQGPDLMLTNKKISKDTSLVSLGHISILQKLEQLPSETHYYRWSSSEDCFTVQNKLFGGRFSSDLTWLAVASVVKQTAFDVRSINNRLVYEVSEYEVVVGVGPRNHTHTVNFKVENDVSTPVVTKLDLATLPEGSHVHEDDFLSLNDLVELRRSKRRNVRPERYLACDNLPDYEIEVTRLGESKTYKLEYDDTSSDGNGDDDFDENLPLALSVQADNEYRHLGGADKWVSAYKRKLKENAAEAKRKINEKSKNPQKRVRGEELAIVPADTPSGSNSFCLDKDFRNVKTPEDETNDIEEMVANYFNANGSASLQKKKKFEFDFMGVGESGSSRRGPKGTRRKYHRVRSLSADLKRDCFYVRESIYDVRSFRKGSVTAQLCRELIRRCMDNIDATLKNEPVQPPVLDQWKEFQSTKDEDKKETDAKQPAKDEEELSEIDMLWKEMEIALASWYLLDDNEESHHFQFTAQEPESSKSEEETNKCEHDYLLDEQVGTVCRLCGFVETEIKDILPPFTETSHSAPMKDLKAEEPETDQKKTEHQELEQFCIPNPCTAPSNIVEGKKGNVWALIPELKDKLRTHQKKAFEFLWRNIAGSLIPSRMEKKKRRRGGCVISHSPGAGKTLLIIAFLVSYLKLFPGSRPLVLAPKTTLYTWYKEIIKWKVPIPVYQIHGGQTYKGEVLKQRMKVLAPGLPRNQDVMHVLDCLEKMQSWLSHPSILLMGYTSFLTLTREDSHYAHRKYMAQLLKQCPGILILDEGHNPRSTKSRLRKGLMKVNTRLRVLLSGTLFQNNFGEYFNTLCLARPSFVNEVLKELDPKYEKRNKERQTQFSLENRGRKLLIDKISKKIDSNQGGERAQALKTLKKLTSKFIEVYEGGTSEDKLPGLECYTLMMKSTSLQQEILLKLQNQRPVYKGFPLELELLITLGAIHPWLIRTTACSGQYFSPEELDDLDQFKFDMKCGSKVRFVMNLIPRCLIRNEKVLIFCHNIAPINLFLQIFERFYGWRKGREVLVLQGDIELFERGRVMDKFEEPGGPSKVMLASITACAEGISLVAASRVILLDSEWNPSKSKQAIARAFRPGQNKVVYVYQLLANGTLEEEKHSRTTWKEWVSDMIFSDEHVEDPSHWQAPKIEDELLREIVEEDRAALFHKILKNEKASNVIRGKEELDDLDQFKFDMKCGSEGSVRDEPHSEMLDQEREGDIELFERGRVMDKFEEPGGPSKVMLASITACAEGISLVAASRVILLDSEWNPSKSKQAIARAFRPGQNKVVYVYQLLANGTLEEEKHSRTTWKEWVSDMIFSDEHVEDPSHWQAPKIEDELLREIVEEDRAALFHKILKNEKASNVIRGKGMLKKMCAAE